MDKKRTEMILVIGLVAVFVLVSIRSVLVLQKKWRSTTSPVTGTLDKGPVFGGGKTSATTPQPKEDKETPWRRDPFSGKIYSSSSKSEIIDLQGISWSENDPRAIVGDEIVKEGDLIEQWRVLKINRDSVIISDGLNEKEVKLE
jgi:hypothetical protein